MKGEVVIATANKKLFVLVLLCKIYSMHFYDFFLKRPMGATLKNIPQMINISLQNVFFLLQGIGHKESQELNSANTDG